jgi:short-subunit dehydrogenase
VKKAAEEFLKFNIPLDLLINNAGIAACPFALTVDGIESQFATNHLGHFVIIPLTPAVHTKYHSCNQEGDQGTYRECIICSRQLRSSHWY